MSIADSGVLCLKHKAVSADSIAVLAAKRTDSEKTGDMHGMFMPVSTAGESSSWYLSAGAMSRQHEKAASSLSLSEPIYIVSLAR